jgi:hypothetical protein
LLPKEMTSLDSRNPKKDNSLSPSSIIPSH